MLFEAGGCCGNPGTVLLGAGLTPSAGLAFASVKVHRAPLSPLALCHSRPGTNIIDEMFSPLTLALPHSVSTVIDQNLTHGSRRCGEEVACAVPMLGLVAGDQPQVHFVHQCRRLKGVVGALAAQAIPG